MLRYVNKNPESATTIVQLKTTFIYQDHQCLVFELLHHSLLDVIRRSPQGVSLDDIQSILHTILHGLCVLAKMKIIHGDLKPANIMNRPDNKPLDFLIIDLGLARQKPITPRSYIQSRYYRAPEVILGVSKSSVAVDMWSLGCITLEMMSGKSPLFTGKNEQEQLYLYRDACGSPSFEFLSECQRYSRYYDIAKDEKSGEEHHILKGWTSTRKGAFTYDQVRNRVWDKETTKRDHLVQLVTQMLCYNPRYRITAEAALRHPFFQPDSIHPSSSSSSFICSSSSSRSTT